MEEINGWISRIVVDFNAFDKKTTSIKFKNIEYQAQQFKIKKKKEHIHQRRSGSDGDVIL